MGNKQILSMALLLVMLSRRRLPGLLLVLSLPLASQTEQAVGTHALHAGVWDSLCASEELTEVVLGLS